MSSPYLVIQITDGSVQQIKQRDTWEEAVDFAVASAQEQCDTSPDKIREELEADQSFADPNGGWSIQLAQADED